MNGERNVLRTKWSIQDGFVIVTFKNPTKDSSTAQVKVNLSPKSRRLFKEQYINQALEKGLIVMTHPESPRHPQPKYKLTEKGIIVLNILLSGKTIPLIFTTAYDEYVLKAFKFNSMDYLLKPINEDELNVALCGFESKSSISPRAIEYKQLEEIYLSVNKENHFLIQLGDSFQYVEICEVAFFYSEEKYIYLHLFSNKKSTHI